MRNDLMGVMTWVVGLLVSLAVGSGMINETLSIPAVPAIITVIAGWFVVVGALLDLILRVFRK
jgi:sorbitol-specific phosphotransferase system component IIBC